MKRLNDVVKFLKMPSGKPKVIHINRLALYHGEDDESPYRNCSGRVVFLRGMQYYKYLKKQSKENATIEKNQ